MVHAAGPQEPGGPGRQGQALAAASLAEERREVGVEGDGRGLACHGSWWAFWFMIFVLRLGYAPSPYLHDFVPWSGILQPVPDFNWGIIHYSCAGPFAPAGTPLDGPPQAGSAPGAPRPGSVDRDGQDPLGAVGPLVVAEVGRTRRRRRPGGRARPARRQVPPGDRDRRSLPAGVGPLQGLAGRFELVALIWMVFMVFVLRLGTPLSRTSMICPSGRNTPAIPGINSGNLA